MLEQKYQDIVAGAITWADYSKTRDFAGVLAVIALFLALFWGLAYWVQRGLGKKTRGRFTSAHPAAPFIGLGAGLSVMALLHWGLTMPVAWEIPLLGLLVALALWRFRPDRKLVAKLRPLQVVCPLLLFSIFRISYHYRDASEAFGPSERGWILLSAAVALLMGLSARALKRNPKQGIVWPTFFSLGTFAAYSLPPWSPLLLDDFHLGEIFTAWHQIAEKGARPYADFIPVQGMLGMLSGYWNRWFYGGELGTYLIAKASLESLVGGWSLVLAARVVGPRLAFWLVPVLAVSREGGDRLLLLLPMTLALLDPWIVARPSLRWPLWALLGILGATYNFPSAFAWTIATGVALVLVTYQTHPRWDRRALWAGGLGVLGIGALIWPWLGGTLGFALANGRSNSVAYGLGVIQPDTTHTLPPEWETPAYRLGIETLRSGGWLLAMALGGVFLWLAWRGKKERSFQPLVFLGSVCLLGPLLLLPYAFGRISAIGLTRTGLSSLVFFGTFGLLGCLVALGRRPASPLWSAGTGAALGYALSLSLWVPTGKIVDAFAAVSVPREFVLVRGSDWEMPKLGAAFVHPERWRELITIRDLVRNSKAAGESYLDLTNRSLVYALLDEKVPVPLASDYHAFDEGFQNGNLDRLRRAPPAAVWLAPSIRHLEGPASTRNYRVYRWLLESDLYSLTVKKPFAVLVHKAKNPNARISGSMEAAELDALNSILQPVDLQRLPRAWGRNWVHLANRFETRAVSVTPREAGQWSLDPAPIDSPAGRADFLRLTLSAEPRSAGGRARVQWTTASGGQGSFAFAWETGTFLLPMGSAPRWLIGGAIRDVRVVLEDGNGNLDGAEFARLIR